MVVRRRAVSLIAALILLAAGAVPAFAQDFSFGAVPRVTVGLTNTGAVGTLCATGLVKLSKSGTAAVTTGTVQPGSSDHLCAPLDSGDVSVEGGALTFSSGNRSVTGTLGEEFVVGHALPNGHAIIAADTFGPNSVVPFGVGLTALVERNGMTFTQANLTGDWRIVGLTGENGFIGGSTENYIGNITFFANRSATGSVSIIAPLRTSRSIVSANVTVAANGSVTGMVTTVEDGDVFTDVTVSGLMTPDKTFVVGVTSSDRFEDIKHGMFFMQKDPGATPFTLADLAGSWHAVALQAVPNNSAEGDWFTGGLSFSTVGGVSQVTASNLVNSAGVPFPPVSDSSFEISPDGVILGEALFAENTQASVFATMSRDKKHAVGVTVFGTPEAEGGGITLETLGVFSMVRLAPPPPASTVQFSTGNYSVQEGMNASIIVTRAGATSTAVTVDYVATDPFLEGSLAGGTLSFPAGVTSRTFPVPTFGNLSNDPDRIVTLQLSHPTNGATLGARSIANLIVLNDDSTFDFGQPTYMVSEKAGKATITVKRTGGLAFPARVPFQVTAGTAVAGKDFVPQSGNLSFAKSIDTARFDVIVKDNALLDGNRSVILDLLPTVVVGAPAGAGPRALAHPSATLIITDDDTPGVLQFDKSVYGGDEGKSVTITVVRAPRTPGMPLGGNVSVDVFTSNNGSAIGGVDYAVTARTLTFTGTQTTQSFSILLTKDDIAEGPEHFLVNLGTPSNDATLGGRSLARVNINDIDRGGVVSLSASTYSVTEGAGSIGITLKRTGGSAANVSVLFSTGGGTATGGVDYGNASTTVVFGLNETTRTVVVPIFQDTDAEGNETFNVTLSNAQGGATLGSPSSAVVTIVDDEAAIKFAQAAFDAREGTAGKIVVVRSGFLGSPVTVPYNISSLSAFPGVDFTGPVSGTFTFKPQDKQAFLTIPTVLNSKVDGNRSVSISLGTPTGGAQLATPSTATFTIVDDDQAGVLRLASGTYTVREGGSVVVDILRQPAPGNGGALVGNISVSYATSSGNASAGSDFIHVSDTVVFGPLETKKSVTIRTMQDTLGEPVESFFFTLSAPTGGAVLGSPSTATIQIEDDDAAVVQFSGVFKNNQPEVMRTGSLSANVSVQYMATSGTAIEGVDFILPVGTLVFPPGVSSRTIPIVTFNDNIAEGTETFTITLMNPTPPARLGPSFEQVFGLGDNDFGGTVSFSNASPTTAIGQSTPITIVRSGGAGTVMTVGWSAIGGTGVAGVDFSPASGQVTFQANQSSQTFFVDIASSPATQGTTVMLGLTPPGLNDAPPSAMLGAVNVSTLTVLGPPPSIIQFSSTSYTVTEDQGFATISVKRTGNLSQPATVQFATSDGTATRVGEDYTASSGTVTFPASEGTYQRVTFDVPVTADGQAEGPETVNLTLGNTSSNAVLGANTTAVLTINDPVPPAAYDFAVLYSGAAGVGLPSINDDAGFAFWVSNGTQTVYSGNMDAPVDLRTAITLPNGTVSSLRGARAPADGGETVAFLGTLVSGLNGIVLAFNNSPTVAFSSNQLTGEPAYSLNGTLAFKSTVDCEGPCDAVYLGDSNGVSPAIQEGDTVPGIGFLEAIRPNTAVNDNATAAFIGTTFGRAIGVFTTTGDGQVSVISSTVDETYTDYGDSLSINNDGTVAFVGGLPDGNSSVVLGYNGGTTVVATTSPGGFVSFAASGSASPVISNTGIVAFLASLADQSTGIFVGPDVVNDKVVATGDIIDGRTVVGLSLGGINSDGRISFRATLDGGEVFEDAAIVATPNQAPCDCQRPPLVLSRP